MVRQEDDQHRQDAPPTTDDARTSESSTVAESVTSDDDRVARVQETIAAIETEISVTELVELLRDAAQALTSSPLDPELLATLQTTAAKVQAELTAVALSIEDATEQRHEPIGKPLELLDQPNSPLTKLTPAARVALRNWMFSKTICEVIAETQYGVLRHDAWRRKTFHRIKHEGETGTVMQVDLQGLNALNKYGVELGDRALEATADFCRGVIGELGLNPNDRSLLGRKGDEFYTFLPGISLEKARDTLKKCYQNWQDQSRYIPIGTDVRKINLYIDVATIEKAEELSPTLARMEDSVEAKKVSAVMRYIQELEELFDPNLPDHELYSNWFNLFKENPVDVAKETDMQQLIPRAAAVIRRYNLPLRCAVTLLDQKRTPRALIELFSRALLQEAAAGQPHREITSTYSSVVQRLRNILRGTPYEVSSSKTTAQGIDRIYGQILRVLSEFTDQNYRSLPTELHDILMDRVSQYDLDEN